MFTEYNKTQHPPAKPTMVWDGECGFCRYWILFWKTKTGDRVAYEELFDVADRFPEIPLKEFKKASRFIETDGQIYSGPSSAYKSMSYFDNPVTWPLRWYQKYSWFKSLSNHTYNFIAKHRPFFMRITRLLWGTNPRSQKKYWLIYLVVFILLWIILWQVI